MKYYLAIDLGASSGRHIVGWQENGKILTEEVFRFPNGALKQDGHLVWDSEGLLRNVKKGITLAKEKFGKIESLAIDSWGVDYVLMKGDEEIWPAYAYRDARTDAVIPEVHTLLPFAQLYSHTGIQFEHFNTIYQLYADKKAGRLEEATDYLMTPEYLLYKLCGTKSHEYTLETTGAMVNAVTRRYDREVIDILGLPQHLFGEISEPGTVIGEYEGIKCVIGATHDTASAVEGIPMEGNQPYISSGTWSLLGVKSPVPVIQTGDEMPEWSNEGGVGYIRYQKNIMGMWIVHRLRDELCPGRAFGEITAAAEARTYEETIDPNAAAFMAPESMKEAFDRALDPPPLTEGDYFRCAYTSLALSYMYGVQELEQNTGCRYDEIYIVGGGARNDFLNRLTEKISGKKVIALPIEAAAIGSIKVQMRALNGEGAV